MVPFLRIPGRMPNIARNRKYYRPTEKGAGMTKAGVRAYRRANPGSKLRTAVTERNPKPKRAARRRNYCSRSAGQARMHGINCASNPNKRICQARRRWRC